MNKLFFLLSFLLLESILLAQNNDAELENNVKSSEAFFWETITAATEEEAKNIAMQKLFESESLKNESAAGKNYDKNNTCFTVKKIGPKFKVTAYINKASFNGKNLGCVPPNITPPVKYEEVNVVISTDEKHKKENEETPTTEKPVVVKEPEPVKELSEDEKIQLNNVLGGIFTDIPKFEQLEKRLISLKYKGKIIFTQRASAFDNISECYIVVFDESNGLKYVLNKGKDERLNLLDGTRVSNHTYQNEKKILYISEQ
jgi:hypothetical protein